MIMAGMYEIDTLREAFQSLGYNSQIFLNNPSYAPICRLNSVRRF
jgi:hypothetical protein